MAFPLRPLLVLLLLVSPSLSQSEVPVPLPCKATEDCLLGLSCLQHDATSCGATPFTACFCLPDIDTTNTCDAANTCDPGSVCAYTALRIVPLCVPEDLVSLSDTIIPVEEMLPGEGSLPFDVCTPTSKCAGSLDCLPPTASPKTCAPGALCYCSAQSQVCFHHTDCGPGQLCAEMLDSHGRPRCVSETAAARLPSLVPLVVADRASPGFVHDACSDDSDCAGDRRCADADMAGGVVDCGNARACACVPASGDPVACADDKDDSSDCPDGEVCAVTAFEQNEPACVSASFVDSSVYGAVVKDKEEGSESDDSDDEEEDPGSPVEAAAPGEGESTVESPASSPSEDEVCVDARSLEHLERSELVYGRHAVARVLCDASGSCATGGHVVVWKGEAMMMQSYCEEVGCRGRVMEVNSPRYRRKVRVASRTVGLEYTAFAARYGSRAEEMVITAAVRLGL